MLRAICLIKLPSLLPLAGLLYVASLSIASADVVIPADTTMSVPALELNPTQASGAAKRSDVGKTGQGTTIDAVEAAITGAIAQRRLRS